MEIVDRFRKRWNLHHALGIMDGKHIPIRCLRKGGGSLYFNYKGSPFLVLLGLVDVDYNFIWFNIISCGSSSDSQIFLYSDLRQKI